MFLLNTMNRIIYEIWEFSTFGLILHIGCNIWSNFATFVELTKYAF
jgi:hypothetical protein